MEKSLFTEYVKKYFKAISQGVIEKLNGSKKKQLTYSHKTMLTKEYSVSGKWESIKINGTMVSADYVAMDSSLPLKKRDSIGKASGEIPKIGMELSLNERELNDLDVMVATREPESSIVAKLFKDVPRVIGGVLERNEATFLMGLSSGLALVEDDKNTGTGIRLNYEVPTENKFGVPVLFSDPTSKPLTVINERIISKASLDGNAVFKVMVDRTTFTNIAKSDEAKDLYAASVGNYSETNRPTPNLSKLNDAVKDEYGYFFEIVDRSVVVEKNGNRSTYKPWQAGALTAVCSEIVGTLTHAKLAEQNHPVAGVEYEVVDDYILVSKYRQNKPSLSEYTSSQARVVPVLAETIYLMDTLTIQA